MRIGIFTAAAGGFTGHLKALTLDVELAHAMDASAG